MTEPRSQLRIEIECPAAGSTSSALLGASIT
jgi:hypothetical protein